MTERKGGVIIFGSVFPVCDAIPKLKDVVDGNVDWNVVPQPEDILAKSVLFNLRIGNVFFLASPYRRNLEIR